MESQKGEDPKDRFLQLRDGSTLQELAKGFHQVLVFNSLLDGLI